MIEPAILVPEEEREEAGESFADWIASEERREAELEEAEALLGAWEDDDDAADAEEEAGPA